jgi:hypothetical protein
MVDGNKLYVELIAQMLSNHGNGVFSLVINDPNGYQIGLWNIEYSVESVPGMDSPVADQYYTALSESATKAIDAANRAETAAENFIVDPSLSQVGQAADAKATGDALVGKAPSGYGLGTVGKSISISSLADLDNIWANGWYAIYSPELIEMGGIAFHSATLELSAYNDVHGHQIVRFLGSNTTIQRYKVDGVVGPWEWENPPMIPWHEYRTTERHNGKAVYAQVFELGTPTNGKELTITEYGCSRIVRYHGDLYGIPLPYTTTGDYTEWLGIGVSVTPDTITVHCGEGREGYGWVNVSIWYTKD